MQDMFNMASRVIVGGLSDSQDKSLKAVELQILVEKKLPGYSRYAFAYLEELSRAGVIERDKGGYKLTDSCIKHLDNGGSFESMIEDITLSSSPTRELLSKQIENFDKQVKFWEETAKTAKWNRTLIVVAIVISVLTLVMSIFFWLH